MNAIKRIQARLDRWELGHLRELALELVQQVESLSAEVQELRDDLHRAEDAAEHWREALMSVEDVQLGLDQAGGVHVLPRNVSDEGDYDLGLDGRPNSERA